MEGALSQGCPEDEANTIWTVFENAGLYCFNKSHSASYALTAYWGAWLKCKYPTATYTIEMKWADDKELPALMGEMSQFSKARLVQPDINRSGLDFTPDFETDEILWSLTRIKQCKCIFFFRINFFSINVNRSTCMINLYSLIYKISKNLTSKTHSLKCKFT